MDTILFSTGDFNRPYDVLDIISFYHSTLATKSVFGKNLSGSELFDAILGELEDKTIKLGADAVCFVRCEFTPAAGTGFAISSHYLMYGTAIKFK